MSPSSAPANTPCASGSPPTNWLSSTSPRRKSSTRSNNKTASIPWAKSAPNRSPPDRNSPTPSSAKAISPRPSNSVTSWCGPMRTAPFSASRTWPASNLARKITMWRAASKESRPPSSPSTRRRAATRSTRRGKRNNSWPRWPSAFRRACNTPSRSTRRSRSRPASRKSSKPSSKPCFSLSSWFSFSYRDGARRSFHFSRCPSRLSAPSPFSRCSDFPSTRFRFSASCSPSASLSTTPSWWSKRLSTTLNRA